MNPDVAVGLCALVAGLCLSAITAALFGAIATTERDLEPAKGRTDAGRGGVDQVSHKDASA